jgi:hypothetical protein
MNRRTRQSGQALVAATFGLVVLLGATGLAVDMGYLRYQKRLQQSAADSAALAGAAEINFNVGNVTTAGQQDSALNGFTDGVNNVTVTVNLGPTSGPNAGNANYVEVLVSAVQPTFFMKIFGLNSTTVTARAVAVFNGNGPKNCVYSLGNGGSIDNDQTLNVPSCGLISNNDLFNSGNITAASVGAVGSADTRNVRPAPVRGIVPSADPLSYLQAPAAGGCPGMGGTVTGRRSLGAVTLGPGTYCGGISVSGGRDVTLSPGAYVITGGGINFNGSGTVSGTGVTFYLSGTGGAVTLNENQTFDLVAPTTGADAGILFFQDSGNTSAAIIDAAGGSTLQGAFYFPGASLLTINGGGSGAAYMIFVAQSLEFNTNITFPSDYSSLPSGSPIRDAVLVE